MREEWRRCSLVSSLMGVSQWISMLLLLIYLEVKLVQYLDLLFLLAVYIFSGWITLALSTLYVSTLPTLLPSFKPYFLEELVFSLDLMEKAILPVICWFFFLFLLVLGTLFKSQMESYSSTSSFCWNLPFWSPATSVKKAPSPSWKPLLHSPLQQLPSFQNISPQPSLQSSKQCPLQVLPEAQQKIPYPCFLSLTYSPSYLSLLPPAFFHTPLPSLKPFLKLPLQKLPSVQQYSPQPWGLPSQKAPLQRSPEMNFSVPWPCLRHFLNSPSYLSPLIQRCTPQPSALPNFHSPTQLSPLAPLHIPDPCLHPDSHSPSQNQPLGHWNLPSPSGLPLMQVPLKTHQLSNSSKPLPCLKSLCHSPSQMRLWYSMTPSPWRLPLTNSPQQAAPLYFFSLRLGDLLSWAMSMRGDRGRQFLKYAARDSGERWAPWGRKVREALRFYSRGYQWVKMEMLDSPMCWLCAFIYIIIHQITTCRFALFDPPTLPHHSPCMHLEDGGTTSKSSSRENQHEFIQHGWMSCEGQRTYHSWLLAKKAVQVAQGQPGCIYGG